jgi:putative acetyltransferase
MLRCATLEDAPAILRVHMASIRGLGRESYTSAQVEAWCGDRTAQSYTSPIKEQFMLVAETQGQVMGFAQLDAKQSTVVAIYVSPAFARQGIGSELLRGIEEHALSLGLSELRLQASLNAVPFYSGAGYTAGQLSQHVVGNGVSLPCLAMSRALR